MSIERRAIPELPGYRYRLGRHLHHDSRSANYPAQLAGEIASVTHQSFGLPLDQGGIGSCFPPGTRIRMADGSERPIEDVRLGEHVVTAEGRTGRVRQMFLRDEDAGLVRIIARGHSHLRLTREHPVLTARGYVKAADLRIGDEIALTRYTCKQPVTEIATAEFVTRPSNRIVRGNRWQGLPGRKGLNVGAHQLPDKIALNADFGRLIGLFLAEGNCDEAKVVWSLNISERDTLGAEIVTLLTKYGAQAATRDLPVHNGHKITVHGRAWQLLLSVLCGNGAGLKKLHPCLTAGPPEFLAAVLSGWQDGDGHQKDPTLNVGSTISHDLALGMFDIAHALGHRPVIRHLPPVMNRHAVHRHWRWEIGIGSDMSRAKSRQTDTHVWRKVTELRVEDYVGPVYNLSVEGDESYVAEGVGVHNCTAEALVGCLNTVPDYAPGPASATGAQLPYTQDFAYALYAREVALEGGTYPPDDPGGSGLLVCQAARSAGLISSYTHVFSADDALRALVLRPGMFGINWYNCLPDGQRVLTSDLRWVPIEKLQVGDELIGFDESLGIQARYRRSSVQALGTKPSPVYEIVTDQGTVYASAEHLFVRSAFLTRNGNYSKGRQQWAMAQDLMPGDKLAYFMQPYSEDMSWEAGWLAGFFDGEGTVGPRHGNQLNFGQALGPTLDTAVKLLEAKGYRISIKQVRPAGRDNRGICSRKPLANVYVRGGYQGALRFLGEMRPVRLLPKAFSLWEGKSIRSRGCPSAVVQDVRLVGTELVHTIGTSTHTLVTEGFLSHNSMDSPDGSGIVEVTPAATVRGGHEVFAYGLDVASELIWFWNSWGASWGLGGRFAMRFATAERLLAEDGDMTFPVK